MYVELSIGYDGNVSVSKKECPEDIKSIIREAIDYFSKVHTQKGYHKKSADDILAYILGSLLTVNIDNTYLIGLDIIDESFFVTDKILSEEFIYRYNPNGTANFSDITKAMGHMAKLLECTRIQVGTLACTSDREHRALTRLYQRQGFSVDTVILGR